MYNIKQIMAGPKKTKSYPLIGEPEMANELNAIERSRPKNYRDSPAPVVNKIKRPDTPLPSSDGLFETLKKKLF